MMAYPEDAQQYSELKRAFWEEAAWERYRRLHGVDCRIFLLNVPESFKMGASTSRKPIKKRPGGRSQEFPTRNLFCTFIPGTHVVDLLGSKLINVNAHSFEFETSNFPVNLDWDVVDCRGQLALILDEVFNR